MLSSNSSVKQIFHSQKGNRHGQGRGTPNFWEGNHACQILSIGPIRGTHLDIAQVDFKP